MNIPTQNNNPGDIKDPSTGKFMQFKDPKEGYAALLNDLSLKQSGKSRTGLGPTSTLADFAKTYAPSSDKNNPAQYAANLANHMGVRPDANLKDLDLGKWADAVAKNEGYQGANPEIESPNSATKQNTQFELPTQDQIEKEPPSQNPYDQLGKLVDFAFPIAGDLKNDFQGKSKKSPLQQIGDAGLSALWFAPGVGEAGEAAIHTLPFAAKLLGKAGAKIAGQALGNAGLGYGSDIATNLSQGKTGLAAATPGLGSLTGGILGGALGKLGASYGQEGVLRGAADSNNSIIGQTKKGAQELAESFSKDRNQGELIAKKGINLKNEYNPETVAYETAHHAQQLRSDAHALTDTLTDALKKVPGSTNVTELANNLIKKVTSQATDRITASEQSQLIADEFSKIRSQYGEHLSASDMNELKKRAWDLSKFDLSTPNIVRKTQRLIGNGLKTSVEDSAKKAGVEGVGELNDVIGQHLDAADSLDRLHGAKAKGGRLGDTLTRHSLETLGGIGGFFGGGPVGSLMGILAGHYGGPVLSRLLRYTGSSPIKTAILNRMVKEDPEIVNKMLQYAKKTPQGLQALKEQLKKNGISIFQNPEKKGLVSGLLSPKKTNGLVPNLLNKIGVRSVTSQTQ